MSFGWFPDFGKSRHVSSGGMHECLPFSQKIRKLRLKVKWNSNFPKMRSEIVDYLQRESSFSVQNGMSEISLLFARFPSSSLSSTENNNRKPNFKWYKAPCRSVGFLILENSVTCRLEACMSAYHLAKKSGNCG